MAACLTYSSVCLRCPCLCLPPPSTALSETILVSSPQKLTKPVHPFQGPSHHCASCGTSEDPATPIQAKINPGGPSQDPTLTFTLSPSFSILAPVVEVAPFPQQWLGQQDDHTQVNLTHFSSAGNCHLGILTERFKKWDMYLTVFTLTRLPTL